MQPIGILYRKGHRIARDVTDCAACLERSGISAHSRREQSTYGVVVVNEDSAKDRALEILRAQGFQVIDI